MNREQFFSASLSTRAGYKTDEKWKKISRWLFRNKQKKSTSSHYTQLNYGTLLLGVADAKSLCHPAADKLLQELSLHPSLLPGTRRNSARAAGLLGRSSQTLDRFLKEKGIGHITYLCPTSSTEQHSADFIPALFTPTDAVISSFALPQRLSGKMLPLSFDGNSATQVKSLLLFSSFVVTATSKFNRSVRFSTAMFAWQKIRAFHLFTIYPAFKGL